MARPERIRLGDLLIQEALLTPEQLDEALVDQKKTGRKLGRIFIDRQWVTEVQIAKAVARQLRAPFTVFEVMFNEKATDFAHYYNKRSEMWDLMRQWLARNGSIYQDEQMIRDLASSGYEYDNGRLKLEDKAAIRKRLGRSPDSGDALALTFAYPVSPRGAFCRETDVLFARSDFKLGL